VTERSGTPGDIVLARRTALSILLGRMGFLRKLVERLHRKEEGITGLETAIVMIAFIMVASVFSYVVVSAGFILGAEG